MGLFAYFSTALFVLVGCLYVFVGASQVYDPAKFVFARFGGSQSTARQLAATKGPNGETTTALLLISRVASVFIAATGVLLLSVGFFVPANRRLVPAIFMTIAFALLYRIMDDFHQGVGLVRSPKLASEMELTRVIEIVLGALFALVSLGTLAGLASSATSKPKAH